MSFGIQKKSWKKLFFAEIDLLGLSNTYEKIHFYEETIDCIVDSFHDAEHILNICSGSDNYETPFTFQGSICRLCGT